MESLNTLCLLVLFLAIVSTPGSPLKVDLTWQQPKYAIPNTLNIRCSPGEMDYDAQKVTNMQLFSLDNGLIAQVIKIDVSFAGIGLEDKITIEGRLGWEWHESFLNVTFKKADKGLSGRYRCVISYLSDANTYPTKESTTEVLVKDQDMESAVHYLIDKVSRLESEKQERKDEDAKLQAQESALENEDEKLTNFVTNVIATQNKTTETIAKLETTHEKLVAAQNKKISDLNTQAGYLRDSMAILNHTVKANTKSTQSHDRVLAELNVTDTMWDQLRDFKTKATYQCAFMAKNLLTIRGDQPLRFRDIVLNLGGAYSRGTGLFRAPVDGLYVFLLTVGIKQLNVWVRVDLRVNNQQNVSRLEARDQGSWDQASTSAVLRLQAGDTVDPRVTDGNWNRNPIPGDGLTTFEGFLLHAS